MKKHGASQFSFGYAVVRADKNLTDQTLRVLSVHSCGLDVVSSYVKVFLCALAACLVNRDHVKTNVSARQIASMQ